MEVTSPEEAVESNRIKVLLEYGVIEVSKGVLDGLAGEELLAGGEVAFCNGGVEVFFGFGFVAVSEDEAEGVGGTEAALSCGLFEDRDSNSVSVAVGCDHSDPIMK